MLLPFAAIVGCTSTENASEQKWREGRIASERGDFDLAASCYSRAIRLDPNYAQAHGGRGACYGSMGDYDRAIIDLTEAIRLDPKCT